MAPSRRLLLGGALLPLAARAQRMPPVPEIAYPALPDRAAAAEGFVPRGWTLEDRAEGDLNGDGRPDLVLVIRAADPANVLDNPGLGRRPMDTNPRILAVAFAAPGGYRLAVQDHALIPRPVNPVMDDPYEAGGIDPSRGVLRLSLGRWASAGTYETERRTLTFRWQDGRFALIGFDSTTVHRATGAVRAVSANFSTGRAVIGTGDVAEERNRERRVALPRRAPVALGEVGDGLLFDPGVPG